LYICRAENLQRFLREGGYMPLESDGYPDSRTLVKSWNHLLFDLLAKRGGMGDFASPENNNPFHFEFN
jgi:hypothetical protein